LSGIASHPPLPDRQGRIHVDVPSIGKVHCQPSLRHFPNLYSQSIHAHAAIEVKTPLATHIFYLFDFAYAKSDSPKHYLGIFGGIT
jgi:hypothetical protein